MSQSVLALKSQFPQFPTRPSFTRRLNEWIELYCCSEAKKSSSELIVPFSLIKRSLCFKVKRLGNLAIFRTILNYLTLQKLSCINLGRTSSVTTQVLDGFDQHYQAPALRSLTSIPSINLGNIYKLREINTCFRKI